MHMTEEESFWMIVNLLSDNGKYQLRGLYKEGLPLLHLRYFQFNQILNRFLPNIYNLLNTKLNCTPEFYTSKWFITIFCYDFPFNIVLRIWDCYLNEGIKFVFRFGITLIKLYEKK